MGWVSDDEKNNEEMRLLDGYRELDAGGRKVVMDMIGQLNFGNRAVRKVEHRPAAVTRPLRFSRGVPRVRFNSVRPEVKVPSAVLKSASTEKITGVEAKEVKAVGVLAKTVGVGRKKNRLLVNAKLPLPQLKSNAINDNGVIMCVCD